jgi:hypothetical protein
MTCQFTINGTEYRGLLDSATHSITSVISFPSNLINALYVYGAPDDRAPITFQLQISRINHMLTTGSYYPATPGSKDFTGYVGHSDTSGNYSTSYNMPAFTLSVSVCDTINRFIKGTFSGLVINQSRQTLTMTNGAFQTYYKY